MNILITGGCGFIGVNLISQLLCTASNRVRVIDNLSVGKGEDLAEIQRSEVEDQKGKQRYKARVVGEENLGIAGLGRERLEKMNGVSP